MNRLPEIAMPLIALLAAGCATSGPIAPDYEPAVKTFPHPKSDHLCVLKPREARPLGPDSSAAMGFLVLLPVVPCALQQYSPETCISSGDDKPYDFLKDLGEIAAKDLKASGAAKRVSYLDEPDAKAPGASHVLHLTVKKATWRRYPTMYMISLAAVPFQLLGAPTSFGRFELDVEAELLDAKSKSLGKAYLTTSVKKTQCLYSSDALRNSIVTAIHQVSPKLRSFVAYQVDPGKVIPATATKASVEQRLRKLQKLKEDGLITDEDFKKRKEEILKDV